MPFCNAWTPFALEIMTGRFASGALSDLNNAGAAPARAELAPNKFTAPAAAPPARELRKNLRRDQRFIATPSRFFVARATIQQAHAAQRRGFGGTFSPS